MGFFICTKSKKNAIYNSIRHNLLLSARRKSVHPLQTSHNSSNPFHCEASQTGCILSHRTRFAANAWRKGHCPHYIQDILLQESLISLTRDLRLPFKDKSSIGFLQKCSMNVRFEVLTAVLLSFNSSRILRCFEMSVSYRRFERS